MKRSRDNYVSPYQTFRIISKNAHYKYLWCMGWVFWQAQVAWSGPLCGQNGNRAQVPQHQPILTNIYKSHIFFLKNRAKFEIDRTILTRLINEKSYTLYTERRALIIQNFAFINNIRNWCFTLFRRKFICDW